MHKSIVIIGAGAAGIGMGIVLRKMERDFLILEKGAVGESFRNWPPGMRFLSPSFCGNYFGCPDLNAVCPDTSPAYVLDTEHPSGREYATYLEKVVDFYELPVLEKTRVNHLFKEEDLFHIKTRRGNFTADFVIWAGGEYQFSKTGVCEGCELGIHNTMVKQWGKLRGNRFAIVGGYESAFDTAFQLAKLKKKSVIFDSGDHLSIGKSDSSFSVSPFTKDRFREHQEFITIKPHTRIKKISRNRENYFLTGNDGNVYAFRHRPILATGFETSLIQVKDFFDWENGSPMLNEKDESTRVKGFFLIGPQVKHQNVVFCFIYKFRQRFALVAEAIAEKLGISSDPAVEGIITDYRQKNFYLGDLSCCENECVC